MDASLIKAFLTLAGAVAALAGVLFLLKRQVKRRGGTSDFVKMKVVGKLDLQAKNKLYVVEAGAKTVLIGVSDKGISTLADLSGEPESARRAVLPAVRPQKAVPAAKPVAAKQEVVPSDSLSFSAFLKSALGKNN